MGQLPALLSFNGSHVAALAPILSDRAEVKMVIWTDLSDITWDRTACLWCEKLNERDIRVSIAMISLGVKCYLGSLTVVKFLIH